MPDSYPRHPRPFRRDGQPSSNGVAAGDRASAAASTAPGSVLVVDDNYNVTRALAAIIRRAGFDAVPCHCGADALSYCDGSTPGAAVIDIHLPDVNGLALAQTLRARFGPYLPIIIVSGDNSMETIKSLSRAGATYFFSKPLNSAALVERLRDLVGVV